MDHVNGPEGQFRAALAGRGILLPEGKVIADGRIHRCDAEGRGGKGDAAYLLHVDGIPAGGFRCMACGAHGSDVVAFYMQRHGVRFIEAAKALGAWTVVR